MMPSWMKELSNEKNNKEFSQLCHDYYKLAAMRVMQVIREKFNVPREDVVTLMMAIFARMLNEGVYSVGSNIKEGYKITEFYNKEHLLNLLKVLNGESLDQQDRIDIDTDIQRSLEKFKKFLSENASDFYI